MNGSLGTQVTGSGDEEVYLLLSLEKDLLIDPLFEKWNYRAWDKSLGTQNLLSNLLVKKGEGL